MEPLATLDPLRVGVIDEGQTKNSEGKEGKRDIWRGRTANPLGIPSMTAEDWVAG